MDNNFSDILATFKRLDESFNPNSVNARHAADIKAYHYNELKKLADAGDESAKKRLELIQKSRDAKRAEFDANMERESVDNEVDESLPGGSTMASAEHHSSGPKFTGYWKGTDPRTPGNKMVGASEGIELKLQNKYNQFLKEYGMTTGGTVNAPSNNPVDQAKAAKELQQTQTNLNKFKSAGVNLPQGVGQASQAAVKTVNNPKADPTQTGLDQNAKKTIGSLGLEMEKLLATGNQSQVQQVANAIKQNKMGTK